MPLSQVKQQGKKKCGKHEQTGAGAAATCVMAAASRSAAAEAIIPRE
jgi:hypothetical protein